ncbi:MAG: HPF/RaiA family ribosome-associated protein [Brevinemataceae bacterium]
MNIIITDRHCELDNKTKSSIDYKVAQKLTNFAARLHNVSIIIDKEKQNFKCECDITSDFGEFFASSENPEISVAVDQTLNKILTEIKKKHDKITIHK